MVAEVARQSMGESFLMWGDKIPICSTDAGGGVNHGQAHLCGYSFASRCRVVDALERNTCTAWRMFGRVVCHIRTVLPSPPSSTHSVLTFLGTSSVSGKRRRISVPTYGTFVS